MSDGLSVHDQCVLLYVSGVYNFGFKNLQVLPYEGYRLSE